MDTTKDARGRSALALLAFPLLLLALFGTYGLGPVLGVFNAHFALNNDFYNFVLPKLAAIQEALGQGQFPFWNPLEGSGVPLFAAGCKPVFLTPLLAVLPKTHFIPVMAALQAGLGLVLFHRFATALGLSARAAAVGAVIWIFNGYCAAYINDITILGTNIWLPLLLFSYLAYDSGKNAPLCLAGAALSVAMQTVGGRPTDLMYNLIFTGLFILQHRRRPGDGPLATARAALRPALLCVGAVALGLCLAGVFVLPFVDHLSHSARFLPRQMFSLSRYLPLRAVAGLVLPGPFPLSMLFLGLPALPFLAVAWTLRGSRPVPFFLWTMAVALSLVLPLGLFDLTRLLPLHAGANVAYRVLPHFFLAAAVLTGIGFDAVFPARGGEGGPGRIPGGRALLAACAVGAAMTAVYGLRLGGAGANGTIQAVVAATGLVACVALAAARAARLPGPASVVLASSLFACMFLANQLSGPDPLYRKAERLADTGGARAVEFLQRAAREDVFRSHAVPGALSTPTSLARHGLQSTLVYEAATPARTQDMVLLMDNARSLPRMLDVNNVRYVVARQGQVPAWAAAYPVANAGDDGSLVLENPTALPRAFLAEDFEVVPDKALILERIAFGTGDLRRTALIEADPGLPPGGGGPAGEARVARYTPDEVAVEVRAARPALLVLLDTYDTSWTATVDGAPAPMLRADYKFRAVPVPAGSHVVRFRYGSGPFRTGAMVSGGALLVLAGLAAWGLALRRRGR